MKAQSFRLAFLLLAWSCVCGDAHARGFGGGAVIAAASYSNDNTAMYSSLFSSGTYSPYQTSGRQAPIPVYGGTQFGNISGYSGGIATGSGGGFRDFVDAPASPLLGAGGATEYTRTIGPNGAITNWRVTGAPAGAAATGLPTDAGLAGPASATPTAGDHSTHFALTGDAALRAASVRSGFVHKNAFTPAWFKSNPRAWAPAAWTPASATAWDAAAWPAVSAWCGISTPPEHLDYGNTIVIANGNVYVSGTEFATAEQFAAQAITIADRGRAAKPAATDAWQPLGVFALVQGDEGAARQAFQLAIDKDGTIRGNMYEPAMDTLTAVYGQVDPQTQRAAWSVGDSKTVVFETGIVNLTRYQTPVLVHFGPDKTQQWLLVRLKQAQGN